MNYNIKYFINFLCKNEFTINFGSNLKENSYQIKYVLKTYNFLTKYTSPQRTSLWMKIIHFTKISKISTPWLYMRNL